MKICPRCQKTYPDDNLNFCLEDGSVLSAISAAPPPPTYPVHPPATQPHMQAASQPNVPSGWNPPPPQAMQPGKKSSKAWVWVLLILGVVVLLCGGGLIGAFVYYLPQIENASNTASLSNGRTAAPPANRATNTTASNTSVTNTSTSNISSTPGRDDLQEIELDIFVKEFSLYGTTEKSGDELIMGAKQKGYYYVLVAPDDYQTEDADTRVTVRNINDESSSLGYGLIFHSNPTPLQQGYAFLIDTKRKKYRVVNHTPQKENSVVTWTASPAINGGATENTLEVRDLDDKIELYINGTMVTSIKNVHGYPGGVAGLYSGDGIKVAFKNLEIRK